MTELLKRLCEENKKVCIYRNPDDMSHFLFGVILAVNDDEIAVQMMTPDGEDDGVHIFATDDVFRIEADGQYSEKMELLLSEDIPEYEITVENDDILLSCLLYAEKNRLLVSIELIDSGCVDITGFVKIGEDGMCTVKQVDEYGVDDGVAYVLRDDITTITFLSEDEKRITRLWEKRRK